MEGHCEGPLEEERETGHELPQNCIVHQIGSRFTH